MLQNLIHLQNNQASGLIKKTYVMTISIKTENGFL